MSVLDRKLRRELAASWMLLSAITAIVVVGVTCFVSMASTYNNLTSAKRLYYSQCRMADFSIELKKAPLAAIRELKEIPGVAEIRPRIQFFATADVDGVTEPVNGLVLSLPDSQELVLNDIVLRRGGYFTDRRENEVIVNEAFAAAHGLEPGDWVRLVLNNRRQELLVVGTAISSEFVYMLAPGSLVPDPEHFGVFYLKHSYAEDVFEFGGAANQVLGRLSPGQGHTVDDVLREAETRLSTYGVFATIPLDEHPSNVYLSNEVDGLRSFAYFMPCIFLAVAAMVLTVLLRRLAEQQRTVVGTLKATGYSGAAIFLHFLKFGLFVGLVGGLLGCAIGYGLAAALTYMYTFFFQFPDLRNHFYPGLHAVGLSVSLLCAAAGSLRGAWSVLRLKPAEAMRAKPPKQGGAILLERFTWLWSRLSSNWRMALRDVARSRTRTLAGIFAAAMGASVLVSGFMMTEASYFMIDFHFKWVHRSDIDLTFKDERPAEAMLEVARLPGVDRAEPLLNVGCVFRNGPYEKKGAITGLAADATMTVPRDKQARPIRVPATGLAMTRAMAERLGVERGDTVRVRPTKGLREEREALVVEIAESYLGTAVYADIDYLSRLIGEESAVSGAQLATDGDPSNTAALYRELKQMPALQAVSNREYMVKTLEETMVANMLGFIGCLVIFSGIVFFGSILNASLVSLAERQREVATLRVLGYGPWKIGSLLLRESMMVTLLGTLLGMPLGFLLTKGMALSYDSEMFRFPVIYSSATWTWTIVLAVLFGLMAHGCVQWNVHRMDWLEALQAKE